MKPSFRRVPFDGFFGVGSPRLINVSAFRDRIYKTLDALVSALPCSLTGLLAYWQCGCRLPRCCSADGITLRLNSVWMELFVLGRRQHTLSKVFGLD